ncbi:MAG: hypothetical protein CMH55_09340 [Myxococcales bacterium]|nr:hypothetical protein [Myxococcales bacterium]
MNRPQLCPKCRTLVGVDETSCHKCGANLGAAGRFVHGTVRSSVELGQEIAWWQIIMGANIALFIVGLGLTLKATGDIGGRGIFAIGASTDILLRMGMQENWLVGEGEWWRLVTSTFLHGGLLHVGFNMYFLAQLGPAAEKIFGQRGFLVIYVLGGVVGGLVQLAMTTAPVVGASGCLMALIGALAGYGRLQFGSWTNPLSRDMFRTLIFITLIGLLPGLHAAHGSHIGGFVGGIGFLFLVHGLIKRRQLNILSWLARASVGVVLLSMVLMVMAAQKRLPNEFVALNDCMRSAYIKGQRVIDRERGKSRLGTKRVGEDGGRGKRGLVIPPECLTTDYGFGDDGEGYRQEMRAILEDLRPGPGLAGQEQRLQSLMGRYKVWLNGYFKDLYGMSLFK